MEEDDPKVIYDDYYSGCLLIPYKNLVLGNWDFARLWATY